MIIQEALTRAVEKLRGNEIPSAHLDAEVLLSSILRISRASLLAHTGQRLTTKQIKKFRILVAKRAKGQPVAYLIKKKEFYSLEFLVDKRVLIPRPETELLVDETIQQARTMKSRTPPPLIVDIGTGSGCVAIVLAKYVPFARIIAIDRSPGALTVAKKNARVHKLLSKILFLHGDLVKPLARVKRPDGTRAKADIIVANLPYLTKDELANVPHEPKEALYGGKLGMEYIERLLMQASGVLAPSSVLLLEISPRQTKALEYLVEHHLPDRTVTFKQDLAGMDRVAIIS